MATLNEKLTILYRDERLIFVDKPSGMVVHRGWARDKVALADIVRDEIIGARVFAIHRLDRGTSGVVGFALDSEMAHEMQEGILERKFYKEYIALVRGPFDEPVSLAHPIANKPGGERVEASTDFYPLKRAGRWSLVKAVPKTGRLHQIRRHLKHLSLPIVGDVKYGKGDVNRFFRQEFDLHRLALHASLLRFEHPENNSEIEISAPVPEVLEKVFRELFDR